MCKAPSTLCKTMRRYAELFKALNKPKILSLCCSFSIFKYFLSCNIGDDLDFSWQETQYSPGQVVTLTSGRHADIQLQTEMPTYPIKHTTIVQGQTRK